MNQILGVLQSWVAHQPAEPSVILNNHCPICPFRTQCLNKAEREDNLTLLDRMTPKLLRKYQQKGIFTINQLSYLFRPRKTRRRGAHASIAFSFELQALALRTRKIYLHKTPSVPSHEVELYLDIEGLPDRDFHYLVGVVVYCGSNVTCHSFWCDSPDDEVNAFQSLSALVAEHPTAPIYHYGSYEPKALDRAAKKHGLALTHVQERLVNVNSLIYGKVYFPSRSNALKALGRLVGATWCASDASGLNSIAWRLEWEATKEAQLKDRIVAYNLDDCHALRRLVSELRSLGEAAASRPDVDFSDRPKQPATTRGTTIHDSLEGILTSAHAKYEERRIRISRKRQRQSRNPLKPRASHSCRRPMIARRVVDVRPRRKCPHHAERTLRASKKRFSEHVLIDLHFNANGCKKTVTKYRGPMAWCSLCKRHHSPPRIRRMKGQVYGHNLKAWAVYQRIVLRLPYRIISQAFDDQFRMHLSGGMVAMFLSDLAGHYVSTEKALFSAFYPGRSFTLMRPSSTFRAQTIMFGF